MFRIALLLIAVAAARIASTYWVFNHTMDEPGHIACGLEWLNKRTFTYRQEQPPLSLIAAAVGPWLTGAPNVSKEDFNSKSPLVLYNAPSYSRSLASARAGELPFFVLAALMVWFWARRLHGELVALASVLLFTTLPPVLAHAGLATTDVSICATLPAAIYALLRWLDHCGVKQTAVLALAIAAGMLSKFTFFIFFPVCVAVVLLLRQRRLENRRLKQAISLAAAGVGCFILVWGMYCFRITQVPTKEGPGGFIQDLPETAQKFFTRRATLPLPAGNLYLGLVEAREHNYYGHLTYLFGERSTRGWWYFFPVVFVYKTPLAFLILVIAACFLLLRSPREHWIPVACAGAILISVAPSHIDLGVRHILALYPLLSIPAGLAAVRLIQASSRMPRILGGFLVLWQLAASVASHPNYIAYFNELAGREPERVRVDSDLDWGQSVDQLARRLQARGIKDPVALGLFASVDPSRHGLDWKPASPWQPSTGWVAVSATELLLSDAKPPDGVTGVPWEWLARYKPVERVGGSVFLYYIPPLENTHSSVATEPRASASGS